VIWPSGERKRSITAIGTSPQAAFDAAVAMMRRPREVQP
jgi:hypothetical protein